MATGRLGAIDLAATTLTVLYTTPANTITTTNISICNRNTVAAQIRVAVINGSIGSILDSDYIEYDIPLNANGVIERTGIVLAAGQTIAIYCNLSNISAVCWGFEDSTL